MAYDFTIRRGDTGPQMRVTVADDDGSGTNVAFDCTGATVSLIGHGPDAIAYSLPMDVVDGPNGIVAMNWTAVQTRGLCLGLHHFWINVVTPSDVVRTFPLDSNSVSLVSLKMLVGDAP